MEQKYIVIMRKRHTERDGGNAEMARQFEINYRIQLVTTC